MKLVFGIVVLADIAAVLAFFFLSRKYIHKYEKEKNRPDLHRAIFFLVFMTACALLGVLLKFILFRNYSLF